jgi:tRNA A-37 threonylcarbamoyl transferase component Bud32
MAHSPARSALDVGTVIGGTYRIEGLLGRGGMGAVFAAGHARLPGKRVAIKVLHAEIATAESLARFRREAEIASRLGHPNIVEVHDFNELPDGTPYLVLEYLPGESLAHRLERGPLALAETFAIVRQVGSALAAAHRADIIHRDLKPQNVFLVPVEVDDGIVERAKVLDFGISKIRGSTTVQTQDTAILGTPQYMSPEQATGNHAAVDARTDVFALGVMTYEMLCGAPAFDGQSVPEVVFKVVYEDPPPLGPRAPGVPPAVIAAIERAMAKNLDDRWPSVSDFVQALTGAPLVTGRRPVEIAPGDGTPSDAATAAEEAARRDALAGTVASGDHAAAVGLAAAATMASGDHAPAPIKAAVAAGAATANERPAAGRRPSDPPPLAPPLAPPTLPSTPTGATAPVDAAPPPPRKRGAPRWLAVIAAFLSAGAALAVIAPWRSGRLEVAGGSQESAPAQAAAPTPPTPAPTPVATAPAVEPAPAAPEVAAPAVVPAPPAPPIVEERRERPARPRRGASGGGPVAGTAEPPAEAAPAPTSGAGGDRDDDEADGLDDAMVGALRDGEAALASDPEEALRLAKRVLNQRPGNGVAWSIRARAHCQLGDREAAVTALRKLDGKPRHRRRAVQACRAAGIDL